jgi:hypothetical protein
VQTSSNAGALQWLVVSVLPASLHETRHLVLGELNLAATKGREADVSDLELVGGSRHFGGCELMGIEELEGWLGGRERERRERSCEEKVGDSPALATPRWTLMNP